MTRPAVQPTRHLLKCHPAPFEAVSGGQKTYEIRRADRRFAVGDTLVLQEWRPETEEYTGRAIDAGVVHITRAGEWPGLAEGYAVLGIAIRPWTRRPQESAPAWPQTR